VVIISCHFGCGEGSSVHIVEVVPEVGIHHHAIDAQSGNVRYLDALPKDFTKEDLVTLRLANNESSVVKTITWRWKEEGKIKKIGTNLWRKIC